MERNGAGGSGLVVEKGKGFYEERRAQEIIERNGAGIGSLVVERWTGLKEKEE